MDISVQGLADFQRRLGTGARTLDAELRPAVRQSGEAIRGEAKHLAKGNRLPNSVQMRSLDGGLTAIIGSVAKSAASIERGRKVGEWAGVVPLTAWIKRYGLVNANAAPGAAVSLKTRRLNKAGRTALNSAARDLAWRIALSIKAKGTKPLPFILPAGQHKLADVQKFINEGVHRALLRIAGK